MKLARLRNESQFAQEAQELSDDDEEDMYVRLEAVSYLVTSCERSVDLFGPYLKSADQQTQLESVIALGEAATPDAVVILSGILKNSLQPYFLRSAAAWSLGQVGSEQASRELVSAFGDLDISLRFEALDNLVAVGCPSSAALIKGLEATDERIVAGCAEALRQRQNLPEEVRQDLIEISSPISPTNGPFGLSVTFHASSSTRQSLNSSKTNQSYTTQSACCGHSSTVGSHVDGKSTLRQHPRWKDDSDDTTRSTRVFDESGTAVVWG